MLSNFESSNASFYSSSGLAGSTPLATPAINSSSSTSQSSSFVSSGDAPAFATPYSPPTSYYGYSDASTSQFSSLMSDPNQVAQMQNAAVNQAAQMLAGQAAQAGQTAQPQTAQTQPAETQQEKRPFAALLHDVGRVVAAPFEALSKVFE
jgi:hypothetical protein